jgi:hypothetical protein
MSYQDGIPWGCPRPAEFSLRFFKADRLLDAKNHENRAWSLVAIQQQAGAQNRFPEKGLRLPARRPAA